MQKLIGIIFIASVAAGTARATENPYLGCINTLVDAMEGALNREVEGIDTLSERFDLGALSLLLSPEQNTLSAVQDRLVRFERMLQPLYLPGYVDVAIASEFRHRGYDRPEKLEGVVRSFAEVFPTYFEQLELLDRIALRLLQGVPDLNELLAEDLVSGLVRSDFAELKLLLLFELSQGSRGFVSNLVRCLEWEDVLRSDATLGSWPDHGTGIVDADLFASSDLQTFLQGLKPVARLYFVLSHQLEFSERDQGRFVSAYPWETQWLERHTPLRLHRNPNYRFRDASNF